MGKALPVVLIIVIQRPLNWERVIPSTGVSTTLQQQIKKIAHFQQTVRTQSFYCLWEHHTIFLLSLGSPIFLLSVGTPIFLEFYCLWGLPLSQGTPSFYCGGLLLLIGRQAPPPRPARITDTDTTRTGFLLTLKTA